MEPAAPACPGPWYGNAHLIAAMLCRCVECACEASSTIALVTAARSQKLGSGDKHVQRWMSHYIYTFLTCSLLALLTWLDCSSCMLLARGIHVGRQNKMYM